MCLPRAPLRQSLRAVFATVLLVVAAAPVHAAARMDLDEGWTFRIDPEGRGEALGWSGKEPAGTRAIRLPHSWNIGEDHDVLGVGWYFRRIEPPASGAHSHLGLHFGATFYSARVFLDGREIGSHEGGFTEWSVDLSDRLRGPGFLAVRIDNRPGRATIPGFAERGGTGAWYDWWAFGGIVREVWMEAGGAAGIVRQAIRTEVSLRGALVRDRIVLRNSGLAPLAVTLRATARAPGGEVAGSARRTFTLAPGGGEWPIEVGIDHPLLWSIDQPNVYRLEVALEAGDGAPLDFRVDTFGIRTIEIRDRHLLVNGERVRLTGLTRHEDSPWEGLAETAGTIRHDYDDLVALHTRLTRPVHYPQHPLVLDYADAHGILLVPEIPVWQFSESQLADPAVQELARRQMREMIEQAGNHPSILAWSVANESATGSPGGVAYFRALRDFIRDIDPGRLVTYADDNLPKLERAQDSAANDADFLLMNQYYGSWHGPASELGPALDRVDRLFPGKMVIISEFGYPGIFARSPGEADEARRRILREQIPVLAARDWIAGAILWCYQDYKSRRNLWPGQEEGYVEHGLVDEWRQRKPSYEVWKRLSAPAQIAVEWSRPDAKGGWNYRIVLSPNSPDQLPYWRLRGYRLEWTVLDEKGKVLTGGSRSFADLAQAQTIEGTVPAQAPLRLVARLLQPDGVVSLDETFALAGRRPEI